MSGGRAPAQTGQGLKIDAPPSGCGLTPLLIEFPWPPKELTPNARRRNHWRVTQRWTKDYRADCYYLTKAAAARGIITAVTFYPPDRRRRDDDGMIGAFKAGRDGVAEALGCDDYTFRPTYAFGDPVRGGKVVVQIGAGCTINDALQAIAHASAGEAHRATTPQSGVVHEHATRKAGDAQ